MILNKLSKGISHELICGDDQIEIKKITSDSRAVEEGELFVALRGTVTDGHSFIEQAIAKGWAVLCEEVPEDRKEGAAYLRVEHTDMVIGDLAAKSLRPPSRKLRLVGVTGTHGKTTIATLLKSPVHQHGIQGWTNQYSMHHYRSRRAKQADNPDALTPQNTARYGGGRMWSTPWKRHPMQSISTASVDVTLEAVSSQISQEITSTTMGRL